MDWYLEVKIQARDKQYSFCPLIPETKGTKILTRLTWMYHVVHNICIAQGRNIRGVLWVNINLAIRKKIDIVSNSIECNHLSRNTSNLLYSKSCQIENWRSLIWEKGMSPPTSSKIFLRHDWTKAPSSKVARQPQDEVARQAKFFQPTQPNPKPICDRSKQLDDKHFVFVGSWPTLAKPTLAKPTLANFFDRFWPIVVLTDFGQTDFGQF